VFEKISRAAEKLATNVSESRRGFLARMGRAALGVAGVFAGLLALPGEAHAIRVVSACEVAPTYGGGLLTGYCVCNNPCRSKYAGSQCRPGAFVRFVGGGFWSICNTRVTIIHPCSAC
jgi:hypothetical protein